MGPSLRSPATLGVSNHLWSQHDLSLCLCCWLAAISGSSPLRGEPVQLAHTLSFKHRRSIAARWRPGQLNFLPARTMPWLLAPVALVLALAAPVWPAAAESSAQQATEGGCAPAGHPNTAAAATQNRNPNVKPHCAPRCCRSHASSCLLLWPHLSCSICAAGPRVRRRQLGSCHGGPARSAVERQQPLRGSR